MNSGTSEVAGELPSPAPLLQVAAALGTRDLSLVRDGMVAARDGGLDDEVGEVILMALFVTGFPAGLQAAEAWSELRSTPPPAESGIGIDFPARGRASCAAVYGSQFEGLLDGLANLHPDLPELVVSMGYGRMMSRPVLPLALRELCLIAMLIPWQAETQLYSHLRGALLVGASEDEVGEALAAGLAAARRAKRPGSDPEEGLDESVTGVWERVRSRRNAPAGSDGET